MSYTLEEYIIARNTDPGMRTLRDQYVLTQYAKDHRWKDYEKKKKDKDFYVVQLPKPWDAIGTPRNDVHYTRQERIEAFNTKKDKRTIRQEEIIKTYYRRKYYAYKMKHRPEPEYAQHLTRILTDLDNVEDILATAGYTAMAAGVVVPATAPVLETVGGVLEAACVPLNLAEASLGLATGPMGAKRAFEALIRLTPTGRLMKTAHTGILGKIAEKTGLSKLIERATKKGITKEMADKIFKKKITEAVEKYDGKYLGQKIGQLPLKHRLKYAMPHWGTLLEAGQAAQTITGYGLVLGPFMGAVSDMAWAGVRKVQGKQVKIYMPWEKPDLDTRVAAKVIKSTSRLLANSETLTPHQQMKVMLAHAYCNWVLSKYLKNKDIEPYIQAVAESDATGETEPSSATTDILENLDIHIDKRDKSYLRGEEQIAKDTIARYEARTTYGEMQAILPKSEKAIKHIQETNNGYLSNQPISEMITRAGESTAATLAGGEQNVKNDIRADFKVVLALIQHNILPTPLLNYGCGYPGIAFGFTTHYPKSEVLQDMNRILRLNEQWIAHGEAVAPKWKTWLELYKMWVKVERLPKDYLAWFETEHGVKLDSNLERPKHYYSWYYDLWDYWRKEVKKLTRLYVLGRIKLTPEDMLKHIGYPQPTLYNHLNGETTHKKLTWIWNQGDKTIDWPSDRQFYMPAEMAIRQIKKKHKRPEPFVYMPDDLMEVLLKGKETKGIKLYYPQDPARYDYSDEWAIATSQLPQIIYFKDYNWNRHIVHTFRALDTITYTEEMYSANVFNTTTVSKELIAKRKRLIGSTIYPNLQIDGMVNNWYDEFSILYYFPLYLKFYIYKQPPLWIRTQEEIQEISKSGSWYPVWLKNQRLRDIFHKWLVTRDYDYKFEPMTLSLDWLEDAYNEMIEHGIKLPDWPKRTVERYKETGKDTIYQYRQTEEYSGMLDQWTKAPPEIKMSGEEKKKAESPPKRRTIRPNIRAYTSPNATVTTSSSKQQATGINIRKTAPTYTVMPPQTTQVYRTPSTSESGGRKLNVGGVVKAYDYDGKISY